MTRAMAAIQKRIASGEREKDDFYRTPIHCTKGLLQVEPGMPQGIWEPACGDGAISRVLHASGRRVYSTDLIDRGFGTAGRDFLDEQAVPPGVGGIVTNPPFKLATEFALHAVGRLCVPYLAMLLRTGFLEGLARHASLFGPYPPARIWVLSRRPTLWRGDEPQAGSGTVSYSWFIWEQGQTDTRVGWIACARHEITRTLPGGASRSGGRSAPGRDVPSR